MKGWASSNSLLLIRSVLNDFLNKNNISNLSLFSIVSSSAVWTNNDNIGSIFGQGVSGLLQQFEFESWLHFFLLNLFFEKNENKQKEAGSSHLKIDRYQSSRRYDQIIFKSSCFPKLENLQFQVFFLCEWAPLELDNSFSKYTFHFFNFGYSSYLSLNDLKVSL